MLRPSVTRDSGALTVIGVLVLCETRLYRQGLVRALDADESLRVVEDGGTRG